MIMLATKLCEVLSFTIKEKAPPREFYFAELLSGITPRKVDLKLARRCPCRAFSVIVNDFPTLVMISS